MIIVSGASPSSPNRLAAAGGGGPSAAEGPRDIAFASALRAFTSGRVSPVCASTWVIIACLVVNDAVKVMMIKWRVPVATG